VDEDAVPRILKEALATVSTYVERGKTTTRKVIYFLVTGFAVRQLVDFLRRLPAADQVRTSGRGRGGGSSDGLGPCRPLADAGAADAGGRGSRLGDGARPRPGDSPEFIGARDRARSPCRSHCLRSAVPSPTPIPVQVSVPPVNIPVPLPTPPTLPLPTPPTLP